MSEARRAGPARVVRPRERSLRLKLTVWYLAVFSAIQITLVSAFVLFRWDALRGSVDVSIERSAHVLIENILVNEQPPETWTSRSIAALLPDDADFALFALRRADGSLLAHSENVLEPGELPFSDEEVVPAGPVGGVFATILRDKARRLAGIDSALRLVTVPFRNEEEVGPFFLQVAVRDDPLLFGPLSDLILIGIPIGLLAALVTSWFIAGRAVAPIQRLSAAARSVSPTRLSERIRVETTDHEVSKLLAELNSALERLEAGYRAQEQFISNVSHELKTPLAVLLTETQILNLGQETLERYRGYAQRVEEEMKRLAQLVESFLTLTRCDLAAGLVRDDEVAVHDLVLDAVDRSQALAEGRNVRVVPKLATPRDAAHDGPVVGGDGDLLCTMLDNLLRNAIRFSPGGASVDVEVAVDAEQVSIAVRDRGPGIPKEYLERIFERFFQVPDERLGSERQGSGIGLSIAQNVARLHGGSISVANAPDGGAEFVVRLPLRIAGLAPLPAARAGVG